MWGGGIRNGNLNREERVAGREKGFNECLAADDRTVAPPKYHRQYPMHTHYMVATDLQVDTRTCLHTRPRAPLQQ